MPMYVYRNLNTGETFELKQSMKDPALTQHPETGEPIKRLVSAPAIAFKGSGFYATDSRAKTSAVKSTESSKSETAPAAEGAKSKAPAASSAPATPSPATVSNSGSSE